jgi:hypothetical protein
MKLQFFLQFLLLVFDVSTDFIDFFSHGSWSGFYGLFNESIGDDELAFLWP